MREKVITPLRTEQIERVGIPLVKKQIKIFLNTLEKRGPSRAHEVLGELTSEPVTPLPLPLPVAQIGRPMPEKEISVTTTISTTYQTDEAAKILGKGNKSRGYKFAVKYCSEHNIKNSS